METKSNNPKKKKVFWLLMFLIIIIIIVSLIIHLKINGTFLSENAKDIIDEYKQTIVESVTDTTNKVSSSPESTSNNDARKILELQNTIKELQRKIDTTSTISNNYNQNIQFVVYADLLLYKLLSGGSFTVEIDHLINVTQNSILKGKLEKLKSSATLGIKTKEELIKNYQTVYKETYLSYLKNQGSTISRIKSYFLYLIFIKQQHSTILNDGNIKSILANVEIYMRDNNFKKAYAEFIKIDITPSNNTQQWLSDILEKIESEDIINEMNLELNKYIATEGK